MPGVWMVGRLSRSDTRVPDCGQFRVRWMSEFCKNYVSGRGWAVSDESKEGPSATGLSAWKYLR